MAYKQNIFKKFLSFALIISLFLSTMAVSADSGDNSGSEGGGDETGNNTVPISSYINDPGLAEAVADVLGKEELPEDEAEAKAELAEISVLNADGRSVVSLSGIEYLSGLTKLSLNGNQIADITPVEKLTALEELSADNQAISMPFIMVIVDLENTYIKNNIVGFEGSEAEITSNENAEYRPGEEGETGRIYLVNLSAPEGKVTWNFSSQATEKNFSFSGTVTTGYKNNWYLSAPVLDTPVLAGRNEVTLSWSEPEGASQYAVYRSSSEDGEYALLEETQQASYTDKAVKDGETYYYKVQAGRSENGQVYWSQYSNSVSITLAPFESLQISLNKKSATLKLGATDTLTATVTGTEKGNIGDITFTSSTPDTVSVDKNGKITALKSGSAKITSSVKTKDGREQAEATADITVSSVSVSMNHESPSLLKGNSLQLIPGLKNTAYTLKTKTFKTSNAKVATVTSAGTVKGIKAGTANITVTVKDSKGNTYTKVVKVTVKSSADKNTSHITSTSTVSIIKGNSYQAKPALKNSTSKISKTTYKTSNKKIATVTSAGTIKGIKAGTAVITMTSVTKDNQTLVKQVTIKVKSKATSATPTLTASGKKTIYKGNSTTVTPKLKNSKSSIKSSTYKTSNKKIATVSGKGVVKGKKAGTATITITSKTKDNHTVTVKVKVKVSSKKTKSTSYINVSSSKSSAAVGKTLQIKRSLKNSGSKISKTTYKSSNSKVASVNSKGKVTGVKKGTATITVTSTTKDKQILTAKIKVKITYAPNEAAIEKELLKLINADRKAKKKSALASNSNLNGASKKRSKELKQKLNYNKRPDGRDWKTILKEKKYSYDYKKIGGNAGWNSYSPLQKKHGSSISDKKIAQAIYSNLNKTTMRSSSFKDAGIGVYYSGGKIYYNIILGAK